MVGTTLGHYEILELLGAGGMGEVYLGKDTRLGRKVAIKVLPAEFASDPERLARFEQEARAAAALNHPHIAVVHDVGSEPGEDGATTHFIVQEYLEGDTLREPLKKGALSLKRALSLATEVAEGLAAAHAAGIIHRDLKPENLFITKDGHAKILDFGLAKLTEAAPVMSPGAGVSMSPTMLGTVAGQVMGTAGYMAPEQVQSDGNIDQRADLFSFGCVIYEMVGGRQPFAGRSVMQTLDLIVNEEPADLAETIHDVPAQLQWILRKALAKDVAERYQDADDLLVDLRLLAKDVESGTAAGAAGGTAAPGLAATETASRAAIPLTVAAPAGVVLVVVAALAGWLLTPSGGETPAPVQRFAVDLPEGTILPAGVGHDIAISPDGQAIVYVAQSSSGAQLYLRRLGRLGTTPLAGTEGAVMPFFSPDGEWVGFMRANALHRVALSGGDPFQLCTSCAAGPGSWGEDGTIVVEREGGLWMIPEVGGDPQLLVNPMFDGEELTPRRSSVLPGGRAVLFESGSGTDFSGIYVVSLETQEVIEISPNGSDPRWSDTGHILFPRGTTIFAVGFDVERFEVNGQPVPVVQNVRVESGGALQAAVSRNGVLAYAASGDLASAALVWVDRTGAEQLAMSERRAFRAPRISPNGERIAVEVNDSTGRDIWIFDTGPGTFRRLTTSTTAQYPLWTPDGESVAFTDTGGALIRSLAADGSGVSETLLANRAATFLAAESWTPDGARLVVREVVGTQDLVVLDVGSTEPVPLIETPAFDENAASLSHDGRWLVYVSNRSGRTRGLRTAVPGPRRRTAGLDRRRHGARLGSGRQRDLLQGGESTGRGLGADRTGLQDLGTRGTV